MDKAVMFFIKLFYYFYKNWSFQTDNITTNFSSSSDPITNINKLQMKIHKIQKNK